MAEPEGAVEADGRLGCALGAWRAFRPRHGARSCTSLPLGFGHRLQVALRRRLARALPAKAPTGRPAWRCHGHSPRRSRSGGFFTPRCPGGLPSRPAPTRACCGASRAGSIQEDAGSRPSLPPHAMLAGCGSFTERDCEQGEPRRGSARGDARARGRAGARARREGDLGAEQAPLGAARGARICGAGRRARAVGPGPLGGAARGPIGREGHP